MPDLDRTYIHKTTGSLWRVISLDPIKLIELDRKSRKQISAKQSINLDYFNAEFVREHTLRSLDDVSEEFGNRIYFEENEN